MREKLQKIKARIRKTAETCGRDPEAVRLVAVSKTMPVDAVHAAIEAGATILGENYIQEAREKISLLSSHPVSWHFIGHLQTNKAKYAVKFFDLIHSVDTYKLAQEINKQAQKIGKCQDILIQVNISKEPSKSGVQMFKSLELVNQMSELDSICIKGLMTMPPFFDDPEKARPYFSALRVLRDRIVSELPSGGPLNELSMGMTGDFEVAIEEGATLVRIGTAIFGKRK